MPIYEYECPECGHRLEALQKISDAPLSECPVCHQPGLRKLVSAASFRLKGGGWYETDFKKEGKRQLAESDSVDKSAKQDTGDGDAGKDASEDAGKKGAGDADKGKGKEEGRQEGGKEGGKEGRKAGKEEGKKKEATRPATGGKATGTDKSGGKAGTN